MARFRNSENILFHVDKDQQITADNLCLGVGSDESIDALIRAVTRPGKDKILTCPPTYGMYPVCATINDVEIVKVFLDFETFQVKEDDIIAALEADPSIKLVYITTPGNPTGTLIEFARIEKILNCKWNGLVVADEAYIDFSSVGSSLAPLVNKHQNLVVLQTVSKSFGLAAIRLGITFANKRLSAILNALKAPYNISTLTSDVALRALSDDNIKLMRSRVQDLNNQRTYLLNSLQKLKNIGKLIGGLDANFLLIQVVDNEGRPDSELAKKIYISLATYNGVVVRYRGSEPGCPGALRITVGTQEENEQLVAKMEKVISELA